ncbi:MAG: hypothetical protein OXF01_11695, partial [Gemmatimonadetes bacterium]|nr:hypothetical protein [Gemmatimonadota bacterium]
AMVLAAVAMDGSAGALTGAVNGASAAAGASAGSAGMAAAGALKVFALASGAHALMIAGEVFMPPPTAHARLAEREMTHGRFRGWFRVGVLGALLGAASPWLVAAAPWLGVAAVAVGLVALLAYEHAYVQAGQSVPIA